MKTIKYRFGFSLIEALIIMSLIVGIAVWSVSIFSDLWQKQQADHVTETIRGVLGRARLYSMTYGQSVVVCGIEKINNVETCSRDWSKKMMTFIDQNGDKQLSDGETQLENIILLAHDSVDQVLKNKSAYFSYRKNGILSASAASIFYCPNTTDIRYRRKIIINVTGRVRIEKEAAITPSDPC